MKIIDKTPLLDEKGQLGIVQRIQGMLQFGFNWPNELQVQKAIISYFDRHLEKGYTLIRNYTLGQSGIMVPIILLGPTGIYVIHITHLKGHYEVKGDTWNVAEGDAYTPAPINVVQRTMRMANAVKSFVERQGVKVPVPIEPVLIAGDPGLHIETVRPAIKVMMIDGIKSYVAGLTSGRPIISTETIYELTERIINPRPPKKDTPATPVRPPDQSYEAPQEAVSRAQTIFHASQEVKPFEASDFDFAMDEEPAFEIAPPATSTSIQESSPAQPLSTKPKPRSRRIMGMTPVQLAIVAALGLLLFCIIAGFAYYVLAFS